MLSNYFSRCLYLANYAVRSSPDTNFDIPLNFRALIVEGSLFFPFFSAKKRQRESKFSGSGLREQPLSVKRASTQLFFLAYALFFSPLLPCVCHFNVVPETMSFFLLSLVSCPVHARRKASHGMKCMIP